MKVVTIGLTFVAAVIVALALLPAFTPRAALASGVVGTGSAASCTDAVLNTALTGGGLVTFNCGSAAVTIDISSGTGTKTISADTTIDGGSLITISGGNSVGVFSVNTGVKFTVQNLTIANGFTSLPDTPGGVYNSGGTLTVTNSTFSGNSAPIGGGIYNYGSTLTVTNSTFSGNSAHYDGGGIFNGAGSALTVTNSTFSGNSASNEDGGGIFNEDGSTLTVANTTFSGNSVGGVGGAIYSADATVTVTNSTFSGNSASLGGGIYNSGPPPVTVTNTIVAHSTSGGNCSGGVTDGGHNIDDGTTCGFTGTGCTTTGSSFCSTNPQLDPAGLANNGGPTQTIALQAESPAINAGDEATCAAPPVNNLDERGYPRPATGCSIGAYEYNLPGACCQCSTSCAAPVKGSCEGCIAVFDATCESGDLCVLNTPTPAPTNTPPIITPTPTITPTAPHTPTNTPGANDCCQCADFCAAPIVGTCGGCAVVLGASCAGGSCITQTPTPTPTSPPTLTAPPTNTLTITPAPTPTMSLTPPVGPVVTFFGLTRADDTLLPPSGTNPAGIPVYSTLYGSGFSIVVEGKPGASGAAVGQCAFGKSNGQTGCVTDLSSFSDLQIEASNPLGNGSPAVCDNSGPNAGGVPAIFPVSFDPTQTNINTVNDLACRFLDGTGAPVGRLLSDACVLFPDSFPPYSYANPASTMEFCGLVTSVDPFPGGDTLVTVRLRDVNGNVGVPAQIIIHVTAPTPSPTPTPTATNTPGANDCCQCADSCAAPIDGTCGGCTAVFGASCAGGSCIIQTPAPTSTSTPTLTALPTLTATLTAPRTNTPTVTVSNTVTSTPTATPQPAATNTQASDNDGCSMTPGASAEGSMLWLLIPAALVAWRRQATKASRW
jgi:predicted outer membrane repeat protein